MTFYDLFINLKHPMRFESRTQPQDDHIARIIDCSTRYDQATAVALEIGQDDGLMWMGNENYAVFLII